ncbi:hypothetical protein [Alicyclobacillus dauci]|uniref:Flagellar operon protein TIGR03826 n=1 Tax=Alicyclobacillus dauci TaxID=1475485 RepID=A0ABY6Z4C4_9BACL|nr:hypothetical protein [Alicyclobacillus dauci]WAH37682.1 hypothetical protein NZD86_03990 [Alicyclobacillus dauci]
MAIANCKQCGRLYNRTGRDICPQCIREQDEMVHDIRQFLKKNPSANIHETADGTGVPYITIVDMIRDGRLVLRDNPNMSYPCERCGEPTLAGRLCSKCSHELTESLSQASAGLREKNNQGNKVPGFFSRS